VKKSVFFGYWLAGRVTGYERDGSPTNPTDQPAGQTLWRKSVNVEKLPANTPVRQFLDIPGGCELLRDNK